MENWQIVLIVFGSSATIMFILIVGFKLMSIKLRACCCRRRRKAYKVDGTLGTQNVERKASDSLYIIDKSGFSPYSSRSNRISVDTHETCDDDNSPTIPQVFNNDSLVLHVKPVLKQTTRCSLDLTGETSIDNELKTGELNIEVQVDINFNPFQEILELKVLMLDHLTLDKMFENRDDFDSNRNRELDIISSTELFQVYYTLWLGDSQTEKYVSKARPFNSRLELNDEYKWIVEESEFIHTRINLIVYMINNTNRFQTAIAQTSFKIQDVYAHKLTRIWLPLSEPDQTPVPKGDIFISLSYLPTAERLTAIIVEARNLGFENNAIFGTTFAKISLLNEKGRMLESFTTSIRKDDPNPQFNEVTIFNVKSTDFNRVYLKVTLFEMKIDQRIRIGHVFVGPNSPNGHWNSVLKQVRRQVAMWHHLYE